MCSPKIMEIVQKRLQKEGPPSMSRRHMLKLGGALAAGAAVAASRPLPLLSQDMTGEVVDLSHVLGESSPHIFGPDFAPSRDKIEFLGRSHPLAAVELQRAFRHPCRYPVSLHP